MARQSSSRVNFNVDIKGINSAEQLSKVMPKLIDQFNQLASSVSAVEEQGDRIKDVKEGIIMMDVNVIKGNINSLQDLGRAYGTLVNQINALEKAGAPVAELRLKAIEQHKRLREKILQESSSTEQLGASKQKLSKSASQAGLSVDQYSKQAMRAKNTQDQLNNTMQQGAQYTRNASYAWLNIGYIIQDSPYGIRGIANNISQLGNAWQLLKQRLDETNQSTGENITAFQAMKNTFLGPTGLVLLLGSLLPTALVLLERHWDSLLGSTEDNTEATEEYISILNELIDLQSELSNEFGEDPLGILEAEDRSAQLSRLAEQLLVYKAAVDDVETAQRNAFFTPSWGDFINPLAGLFQKLFIDAKKYREEIEELGEEFGELSNVDFDELIKEIEEIEDKLSFKRAMLDDNPILQLEKEWSRNVRQMIADYELFSDEVFGEDSKAKEAVAGEIESWIEFFERNMLQASDRDVRRLAKNYVDKLRKAIKEEVEEETEEEDIKILEDQYDFRSQLMSDLNELRLDEAERSVNIATSSSDKIKAIKEREKLKLAQLDKQEFDNHYQKELEKKRIVEETSDEIQEIERNALLNRLEFQSNVLSFDMDSAENFDDRINAVNEYYNRRGDIIANSVEDEEQMMRELHLNELERQKRVASETERLENQKREMYKMTAGIITSSFEAVGNFINASAKSQFRVRQISSAAQAIINGYLGASKTVGDLGIFGIPASKLSIAFGYAQAAAIMSQSYGSAKATGARGFQGMSSYRGFDFEQQGSIGTSFEGSRSVNSEATQQRSSFPSEVKAKFTDGFGKTVSEGMLQLQKENKEDLGLWGGN